MPPQPHLVLIVSDLMDRMRDKTGGVSLNRLSVHGLMFADDVVLVAETQEKLQAILDELSIRVFSRDVVLGGKLLLWGEKNVKNIQKTNEICYCLGGKFKT